MAEVAYRGADNLERMATLAKNYNQFLARAVQRNCGGVTRLVDFGAGTGTLSLALRERGYQIACVEPDTALRQYLHDRGLQCYTSIEAFDKSSLDFIFTLNVLEHIEDDVAVIGRLYSRLKPGGVLYVYVPAFTVLFSSMDRKVGHYRRYTKATMLARLKQAGFEIRRARYTDSLGFVASLWFKWFGNRHGDLNSTALRLYDRVVFPVSRFLDLFIGGFVGKNLAVTAVRPP